MSVSLITEVYRNTAIKLYEEVGFILCDSDNADDD